MRTEGILGIFCEHYGVSMDELTIKDKIRPTQKIVEAKQVAIFLICQHTGLHRVEIMKIFGYSTKASVNMARRRVKRVAEGNRAFRAELENLNNAVLTHPDIQALKARTYRK